MNKLPKTIDDQDRKFITYILTLTPHEYKNSENGWELAYKDTAGNCLISIVGSKIESVADIMINELTINYNEYLRKSKFRNNRRRSRTHK